MKSTSVSDDNTSKDGPEDMDRGNTYTRGKGLVLMCFCVG